MPRISSPELQLELPNKVLRSDISLATPEPSTELTVPSETSEIDKPSHDLQDINNILSSQVTNTPSLSAPNPIHPDGQDECNYTLTQCIDPENTNHLNHSSLSELLHHQTLLPFEKDQNVGVLNYKRVNQPIKYGYDGYFSQCSLITLLEQNLATQVCMCGVKSKRINGINPTGLCNRPRLCWPCASRAARRTLRAFQPRFHQHEWGFLTISYHGQLPLTYLSGAEWWLYWDAAKSALKRFVETKGIDGAMFREELAIPSLSPTTAIPHLHAIIPTGCMSQGALDRLANWVRGHRDDLGDGVVLEPSIDFRPIPTEKDFERVVSYLHKPLNFVTPYTTKWDDHASREDKVALNRSMRDLIEAVVMHPKGRIQFDYCGNMRASSKAIFIGVPKDER